LGRRAASAASACVSPPRSTCGAGRRRGWAGLGRAGRAGGEAGRGWAGGGLVWAGLGLLWSGGAGALRICSLSGRARAGVPPPPPLAHLVVVARDHEQGHLPAPQLLHHGVQRLHGQRAARVPPVACGPGWAAHQRPWPGSAARDRQRAPLARPPNKAPRRTQEDDARVLLVSGPADVPQHLQRRVQRVLADVQVAEQEPPAAGGPHRVLGRQVLQKWRDGALGVCPMPLVLALLLLLLLVPRRPSSRRSMVPQVAGRPPAPRGAHAAAGGGARRGSRGPHLCFRSRHEPGMQKLLIDERSRERWVCRGARDRQSRPQNLHRHAALPFFCRGASRRTACPPLAAVAPCRFELLHIFSPCTRLRPGVLALQRHTPGHQRGLMSTTGCQAGPQSPPAQANTRHVLGQVRRPAWQLRESPNCLLVMQAAASDRRPAAEL
jgi:hypothetical protein